MTTPSVGSISVKGWKGRLQEAHRRIGAVDPAAGVNGALVVRAGYSTGWQPIQTIEYFTGDDAAVEAQKEVYRALDGEVADVVDSMGKTWSNTVLQLVACDNSRTLTPTVAIIVAQWMMLVRVVVPS